MADNQTIVPNYEKQRETKVSRATSTDFPRT